MKSGRLFKHVGAPDPELRTSPIAEFVDEVFPGGSGEQDEHADCWYNSVHYLEGDLICTSSAELLRCECGAWVKEGSCDPDNP